MAIESLIHCRIVQPERSLPGLFDDANPPSKTLKSLQSLLITIGCSRSCGNTVDLSSRVFHKSLIGRPRKTRNIFECTSMRELNSICSWARVTTGEPFCVCGRVVALVRTAMSTMDSYLQCFAVGSEFLVVEK